jgi:nitrite reductase (NO-forming) / hydroxylamine reductase
MKKFKTFRVISLLVAVSIYSVSFKTVAETDPGQELYQTNCSSCHGANGEGVKGSNPPLQANTRLNTKKVLLKTVMNGASDPIEVNGVKYQGHMPSFDWLDTNELVDLLNYVSTSFTTKKYQVSEKDVESYR